MTETAVPPDVTFVESEAPPQLIGSVETLQLSPVPERSPPEVEIVEQAEVEQIDIFDIPDQDSGAGNLTNTSIRKDSGKLEKFSLGKKDAPVEGVELTVQDSEASLAKRFKAAKKKEQGRKIVEEMTRLRSGLKRRPAILATTPAPQQNKKVRIEDATVCQGPSVKADSPQPLPPAGPIRTYHRVSKKSPARTATTMTTTPVGGCGAGAPLPSLPDPTVLSYMEASEEAVTSGPLRTPPPAPAGVAPDSRSYIRPVPPLQPISPAPGRLLQTAPSAGLQFPPPPGARLQSPPPSCRARTPSPSTIPGGVQLQIPGGPSVGARSPSPGMVAGGVRLAIAAAPSAGPGSTVVRRQALVMAAIPGPGAVAGGVAPCTRFQTVVVGPGGFVPGARVQLATPGGFVAGARLQIPVFEAPSVAVPRTAAPNAATTGARLQTPALVPCAVTAGARLQTPAAAPSAVAPGAQLQAPAAPNAIAPEARLPTLAAAPSAVTTGARLQNPAAVPSAVAPGARLQSPFVATAPSEVSVAPSTSTGALGARLKAPFTIAAVPGARLRTLAPAPSSMSGNPTTSSASGAPATSSVQAGNKPLSPKNRTSLGSRRPLIINRPLLPRPPAPPPPPPPAADHQTPAAAPPTRLDPDPIDGDDGFQPKIELSEVPIDSADLTFILQPDEQEQDQCRVVASVTRTIEGTSHGNPETRIASNDCLPPKVEPINEPLEHQPGQEQQEHEEEQEREEEERPGRLVPTRKCKRQSRISKKSNYQLRKKPKKK